MSEQPPAPDVVAVAREKFHCPACGAEAHWNAAKQASKVKASVDPADGRKLLDMIDEIDAAWKATGGAEKTRVAGRPG